MPVTDSVLGIVPKQAGESGIDSFKRYVLKTLSVSLAVWIGMMPIIAAYFGIVTPSVVLSNFIAIPVLFVVIILGGAVLLTGLFGIYSPIAAFFAKILTLIVTLFMGGMERISEIPLAFIRVSSPEVPFIAGFYAVLFGAIILTRRPFVKLQNS